MLLNDELLAYHTNVILNNLEDEIDEVTRTHGEDAARQVMTNLLSILNEAQES